MCDVQSLLCLPVTVCVWQGAWLLLSCQLSRHTCSQFQGNHALLKSLVGAPRRGRIIPSWCVLLHASVSLPSIWFLPALLSLPLPAGICLPCSPCRFQPASAFPALRAVPPCTSRTSSAGRSTRYRPDLVFPPSRRHLPYRSAAVPPVPDSSAHPAASSRHLLSLPLRRHLLSLPLRRHLLSCSACRPHRHLTCTSRRSAGTYPVSVPCRSSRYLTLLLPLPVSAWFLPFTTHPAFNKLYLKLLSCVCLCVGVQIQTQS